MRRGRFSIPSIGFALVNSSFTFGLPAPLSIPSIGFRKAREDEIKEAEEALRLLSIPSIGFLRRVFENLLRGMLHLSIPSIGFPVGVKMLVIYYDEDFQFPLLGS